MAGRPKNPIDKELQSELEKILEANGWSGRKLARLLDIPPATMNRLVSSGSVSVEMAALIRDRIPALDRAQAAGVGKAASGVDEKFLRQTLKLSQELGTVLGRFNVALKRLVP